MRGAPPSEPSALEARVCCGQRRTARRQTRHQHPTPPLAGHCAQQTIVRSGTPGRCSAARHVGTTAARDAQRRCWAHAHRAAPRAQTQTNAASALCSGQSLGLARRRAAAVSVCASRLPHWSRSQWGLFRGRAGGTAVLSHGAELRKRAAAAAAHTALRKQSTPLGSENIVLLLGGGSSARQGRHPTGRARLGAVRAMAAAAPPAPPHGIGSFRGQCGASSLRRTLQGAKAGTRVGGGVASGSAGVCSDPEAPEEHLPGHLPAGPSATPHGGPR